MKRLKQLLAGFLAVAMVVAIATSAPMKADATNTTETVYEKDDGVIYVSDTTKHDFETLWKDRIAPTRAGHVFGGWYIKNNDDTFTAIKESQGASVDQNAEVCAKFVPAEVLSVRAQLETKTENTNGDTDKTYLRLLSAVNGLDYQNAGFDIFYNKVIEEQDSPKITKVYSSISNSETDNKEISASQVFGKAATHFSVLRVADIEQINYKLVIYVTPHWTTLDGTTVYGQAKYVRVMDGYADNHYISVPINFLTGSPVAAGQIEMNYDNRLELVDFDEGLLMPEMEYHDSKNGTVKFVANVANKTNIEPGKDIYANVWFKVKSGVDTTTVAEWDFQMKNLEFCNWNTDDITDIEAWDVKYLNLK